MARIEPDNLLGRPAPLSGGEAVLTEFRADPGTYWRAHLRMAVVLGAVAGLALVVLGNPFPWTGPVAAVLAIGARAAILRSEALTETWRLTGRRLLGPSGRIIPLDRIAGLRLFLGDVQIVTRDGDKHLMKYLGNAPAAIAAIRAAQR
jgi:hypothetical protein